MKNRSDFLDGENLLFRKSFVRKRAENVGTEKRVGIVGLTGFESIMGRSGKLRESGGDVVEFGLRQNLVAGGNHDSDYRFEAGFFRFFPNEFPAFVGMFFSLSLLMVGRLEKYRQNGRECPGKEISVMRRYSVGFFKSLALPIVRDGTNENLNGCRLVFGKLSERSGNGVDGVGFEFLVGTDRKERVSMEHHFGSGGDFSLAEDVRFGNLFDHRVRIESGNLLFDEDPGLSWNRDEKQYFAVLREIFEGQCVGTEKHLSNPPLGKPLERGEKLLHNARPFLKIADGFFPVVEVAVFSGKGDPEKRGFEASTKRYLRLPPKYRVCGKNEGSGCYEYRGFLSHRIVGFELPPL